MTSFHQVVFIGLSVVLFSTFSLIGSIRNRRVGPAAREQQKEWWKPANWGSLDWLATGFFAGYACVILIYWVSGWIAN